MEKEKVKFSKWIVALVILMNCAFAGAVLYIFLRVGSEPTSLVVAWFSFTTIELWALATIRKKEMERGEHDGVHLPYDK